VLVRVLDLCSDASAYEYEDYSVENEYELSE